MNTLLVVSFLVALVVDVAFPLLLGAWLVRRYHLRWVIFFYGAVVFVLAQLVTRVPLIQIISAVWGKQIAADPVISWIWLGALALTAGLFEEVGRWLGYRWFFRRIPRTWANALLYGAGHEGAESILLVGLAVVNSLLAYVLLTQFPSALPADQIATLQQAFGGLQGWEPLLGGAERIMTMAFQISAAVLVLQVFVRHSIVWLWIAIGWHALTDFGVVVIGTLVKPLGTAGLFITEGWVLVIALLSIGIILRLRPRGVDPAAEAAGEPLLSLAPAGSEPDAEKPGARPKWLSYGPAGTPAPSEPPPEPPDPSRPPWPPPPGS